MLVLLAFGGFLAKAEEEEVNVAEDEDEYEDMDAHEVSTRVLFVDHDDGSVLPMGEDVTVLVDFANDGQDVFNVTRIAGFLHSRFDIDYYIQNFTKKEISGVVAPGAHVSLAYTFKPDAKLEPLEYYLSGVITYKMEGSDDPFELVFTNATVHLVDTSSGADFGTCCTYLMAIVALSTAGYFAYNSPTVKKIQRKQKKKAAAAKPVSEADWEVKAYQPRQTSKARRGKK